MPTCNINSGSESRRGTIASLLPSGRLFYILLALCLLTMLTIEVSVCCGNAPIFFVKPRVVLMEPPGNTAPTKHVYVVGSSTFIVLCTGSLVLVVELQYLHRQVDLHVHPPSHQAPSQVHNYSSRLFSCAGHTEQVAACYCDGGEWRVNALIAERSLHFTSNHTLLEPRLLCSCSLHCGARSTQARIHSSKLFQQYNSSNCHQPGRANCLDTVWCLRRDILLMYGTVVSLDISLCT